MKKEKTEIENRKKKEKTKKNPTKFDSDKINKIDR